jgi:hypothetical protein
MRPLFQLRDEGEVGDFLGIRIEKQKGNSFPLTQTGLIEKVIKAGGMEDCNKVATPAETSPVGDDLDGLPFSESWEYASFVGMIMYLTSNTQSYITYTVHQATRYSHGTKNSHASAKSTTGHVIKFCDVPILWVSKMQIQIALSTMEAEYIALSQSTRDLIPIREILNEIMLEIFDEKFKSEFITHSKVFQDGTPSKDELIPQSEVFEDNMACMKFAQMPKLKMNGLQSNKLRRR